MAGGGALASVVGGPFNVADGRARHQSSVKNLRVPWPLLTVLPLERRRKVRPTDLE
jgi:hypothetical protein